MAHLCENCNKETDHLPFCPHCGLAQTCTTCDRPFDRGAKFCGKCGTERKGPVDPIEQKSVLQEHQKPIVQNKEPSPIPQQPNKRKIPPVTIGIIVAALVFIAIISSNLLTSPEKQIEKTVTKYMQAVEKADYQTAKNLYHPDSPYIDDISDFLEMPSDLKIEVHDFRDFDIDDDYAEVTVLVTIESFIYGEKYTEDVYVELMKLKNKWYLYDVY